MLPDEKSYSFLLCPKIMTATSTEQSTLNSCAFLKRPPLRLRKVTERLRSSLIGRISIFLRPIAAVAVAHATYRADGTFATAQDAVDEGRGCGGEAGLGCRMNEERREGIEVSERLSL